ncbi:MAG TPA: MFS transporter [Anaeromyxobacter sp.]
MAQLVAAQKSPGEAPKATGIGKEERLVIVASSLGTVFEWYDFYLYGSLAAIISRHFFVAVNETTSFIFALLAFSAGFFVRPFGALVFGRLGDMIGRKYTFLITIMIMGLATSVVGFLPTYATIGMAAPVILLALRLLQGLALGGEYGGAATYVCEHAQPGKRGFSCSWIQMTATVGLFLSLLVIVGTRLAIGTASFEAWGWRVPFIISLFLLVVSVYIRMKLNESPVFRRMKEEGKASKAPITESFFRWGNLKIVLAVLFGGLVGQAVVWYTGMFYELFFLLQMLKLDSQTTNFVVAASLIIGTPFFVVFGVLSDKIGRKKIILTGCALAALTLFPIFKLLTKYANPDLLAAQANSPVTVVANPKDCSFQFDPIGKSTFKSSCDVAKSLLAKKGIPYENQAAPAGTIASVKVGSSVVVQSFDGLPLAAADFKAKQAEFAKALGEATKMYPAKADMSKVNYPMVMLLLVILVIYVCMVYAPMGPWLVELFPARIRYTSLSLPYHIGNGWFGGFLPTIAFAIVAASGDIYSGLWYPVLGAALTVLVGVFFMRETDTQAAIHHDSPA